jgi:hypothetical protein
MTRISLSSFRKILALGILSQTSLSHLQPWGGNRKVLLSTELATPLSSLNQEAAVRLPEVLRSAAPPAM